MESVSSEDQSGEQMPALRAAVAETARMAAEITSLQEQLRKFLGRKTFKSGKPAAVIPDALVEPLTTGIKAKVKASEDVRPPVAALAESLKFNRNANVKAAFTPLVENAIKERYVAGATIGGLVLVGNHMAAAIMTDMLDSVVGDLVKAYKKECDLHVKQEEIKKRLAEEKARDPDATMEDVTDAFFKEKHEAKIKAASEARDKAGISRKKEKKEKKDEFAAVKPDAVAMPASVKEAAGKCFADDNVCAVIYNNDGGTLMQTRFKKETYAMPTTFAVPITKGGRHIRMIIRNFLVMRADRFIVQYTCGDDGPVFFGKMGGNGILTDIDTIDKPFDAFFKISTNVFFACVMDGTNTHITTYVFKRSNVGAEGDLSVPFSVTSIINWAADPNSILINGGTKQHLYKYADEGVDESPAAGAGKPSFAHDMIKSLPEEDDSVLDSPSEMAEDA